MKTMSTSPFEFVKAINEKKEVEDASGYNPFLSNIALSYHLDTVLLSNEMNIYPNLPPVAQFDFLYESVTKKKRWSKWFKEVENPHLDLVMEYFSYSKEKALEALQVLTQENIRDIQLKMDKGSHK